MVIMPLHLQIDMMLLKILSIQKSNGCTCILCDHIIHAGDRLACYLALLFTSMLCHGSSPDGMLLGIMLPLPKGKDKDVQGAAFLSNLILPISRDRNYK